MSDKEAWSISQWEPDETSVAGFFQRGLNDLRPRYNQRGAMKVADCRVTCFTFTISVQDGCTGAALSLSEMPEVVLEMVGM